MKSLCIITARGGSKRIPRKNIKDFLGKPIIAYSIEGAMKSSLFSEVMVSTDDEEIATISKQYGASVPFLRSAKTSDDFSTTADVLVEVIEAQKKLGNHFEAFCCLYPTAPFVTSDKLKEGFEKLINSQADSVIPIVEFSYPPQRGLILSNEKIRFKYPENLNVRSQDLEKMYHDIGQFYWAMTDKFIQTKNLLTENTSFIKVPQIEIQDIDNEEDWKIAEFKYSFLHRKS